jgi:hypothetical protein
MDAMVAKPEWLGWLLFAAFACGVSGGYCLFKQADLDSGIRRGLLRCAACVLFAATLFSWGYEEHYVVVHAPRVTLSGGVTALEYSTGSRGGPFVGLRIDERGWEYHPFYLPIGNRAYDERVLSMGDSVKMVVRLWDVKVETIDETAGSHAGWHAVFDHNAGLEWAGMFLAVPILIAGVILLVEDRGEDGQSSEGEDRREPDADGMQTLGLNKNEER